MKLFVKVILAMGLTPAWSIIEFSPILPLSKIEVYSFMNGSSRYTCNKDPYGNPFIDCYNMIAVLGRKNETLGELDKALRLIFPRLNSLWRNFGDYCLPFGKYATSANSTDCLTAETSLIKYGYYNGFDGSKVNVTSTDTQSWIRGLNKIYGWLASKTPAILWPEADIVMHWNSTGTSLKKRTLAFGSTFDGKALSCNKDDYGNPYQDCLNMLAVFCYYDATVCQNAIDTVFGKMNPSWTNYLSKCASWKNNQNYEQGNSDACLSAGDTLIQNTRDISYLSFTSASLIGSIKVRVWTNQTILKSTSTIWSSKYSIALG